MSCGINYIPQLHAHGLRMTPQRMAILHALHHSNKHLTPTQVYALARKDYPSLTEPTVYRTLEDLAKRKIVLAAHVGKGKMVYELSENNDHHHLICRKCNKSIEVEHAFIGRLYRQLESSTGYKLDSSHVTLFGLCPKCQKGG